MIVRPVYHLSRYLTMDCQPYKNFAERISTNYLVDVSQDDISLVGNLLTMCPTFPEYAMFMRGDLRTPIMGMWEFLHITVPTFPYRMYEEPTAINSLLMLLFIIKEEHLRRLIMKYLRESNIPCIVAILDKYFG